MDGRLSISSVSARGVSRCFLLVGWFAAGGGLFGSFADWSVCRGAVRTLAPEDTCPPSQPVVTAAGRLWCISGGCYVIK